MLRSANHRQLTLTVDATSECNVDITIPLLGQATGSTDDANIFTVEFGVLPSGTTFTAAFTDSNDDLFLFTLLRDTGPVDTGDRTFSSASGFAATATTISDTAAGTKMILSAFSGNIAGLTNGVVKVTAVTPTPTAAPTSVPTTATPTPAPVATPAATQAPTQVPTAECTPAPGCGLVKRAWNYVRGDW